MSNAKVRHRQRRRKAQAEATAEHERVKATAANWAHYAARAEGARLRSHSWSLHNGVLSVRAEAILRSNLEKTVVHGVVRV
jgi:hypothetical protein